MMNSMDFETKGKLKTQEEIKELASYLSLIRDEFKKVGISERVIESTVTQIAFQELNRGWGIGGYGLMTELRTEDK